jgi:hypothetical protein
VIGNKNPRMDSWGGGAYGHTFLMQELPDRWGYVRGVRAGMGGGGKQVEIRVHVLLDTHWSSVCTDVSTERSEYIIPYGVCWQFDLWNVIVVKNYGNNFRKGISVIGPSDFSMDHNSVRETMEVGGTVTRDDDNTP